ncbi:uncharacterized protein LOC124934489 [Impatiens glandulifera]|uniref:uncharacterized protein LOC124934489 n=1 Tax=Impatiens glandulifera TaxID=253017 RepID=UPI001FB112BC|nr:uncharacterized protein LOC124934489 [Impatiens glandulifera]
MDHNTAGKPNLAGNILVRLLSFIVLIFLARFAYLITVVRSNSYSDTIIYNSDDTAGRNNDDDDNDSQQIASADRVLSYYSSVFQDLIADGFLSPDSKALCIGKTPSGLETIALKRIGVTGSVAFSEAFPFKRNKFDFIVSVADSGLDSSLEPGRLAYEVLRTLKPGGFFVVHTSAKDEYSLNSLLDLFNSCRFIRSREIDGLDSSWSSVREIVLKRENWILNHKQDSNKCSVSRHKLDLVKNAEPLILEEPLKPWITLKRNVRNINYLTSIVDIRFKNRYIYIDVGSRNYGSSIGSWFRKQYPKQNKTFEIYAMEADKAFHEEYKRRKKITLLPYAAWVRNETLFFEISREQSRKNGERGRGMGRIQGVQSSSNFMGDSEKIQGMDFAEWLKKSVTERDFVVMKMDVEGTEFHLIPRLVESGAICLIDEIFLECHYNRWQRCCPGERSSKYGKTYGDCLELLRSLRKSGVLVHQWF